MDLVKSITLGFVQGITEFLPISSTAHLKIVPALLHWKEPSAASSAVIQLGTVAAVLIYFAKDLLNITSGFLKSLTAPKTRTVPSTSDSPAAADAEDPRQSVEARLGWGIIIGTIPIIILGLALKHFIEKDFRSLYVIAAAQIIMGLALYAADKLTPKTRSLETITVKDCVMVGFAQCMALIPGSSRSGSTLIGAFLTGLNREAAARFSFLLSIPATALAGLFELKDVLKHTAPAPNEMNLGTTDLAVATIVAMIVGYASIAWLLNILKKYDTLGFVIYRVLLGITLFGLLAQGYLHP